MTSHPSSEPEPATNSDGYERRDVDVRAIVGLVGGVVVLIIVSQVGLWWLLAVYGRGAARRNESVMSLAEVDQLPPPPRLQAHPTADYREFREQQQAYLASYGWVDRPQGVVHIPLARARELVLAEGLNRGTSPPPVPVPMPEENQP